MKPFNLFLKLKVVLRWGFFLGGLGCVAQNSSKITFQVAPIIPSGKNTPVPVFCSDTSIWVAYKTRFFRNSKSELGYAEFLQKDLSLVKENWVLPSSGYFFENGKIQPLKKFYTSDGIVEIGQIFISRKVENQFFARTISWQNFEISSWKRLATLRGKEFKNDVPNFRLSHDSTALLGTLEQIDERKERKIEIVRFDLKTQEIFSQTLPFSYSPELFRWEGFSEFENGKIGLIGQNSEKWNLGKKQILTYDPLRKTLTSVPIPVDLENTEIKIFKKKLGYEIWGLSYLPNKSIFHEIRRWYFDATIDSLFKFPPIALRENQQNSLQLSFHRLSGRSLGFQRNQQRNFKIFQWLSSENEDWLLIQAFDQWEKCNQYSRGIPICNWIYSYGDVLCFQIKKMDSLSQLFTLPRYREYEVPLIQGDAGYSFFHQGEMKLLFGDEFLKGNRKKSRSPSTLIFSPSHTFQWKQELLFNNKKENLFLDETTGIKSHENCLIFGGLKNKKSTIIKINLQ